MNKYLKYGLIFIVGGMSGTGISWVILKKRFEKRLEEENTKNQQYYIELLGYHEPEVKDLPEELENEPASDEVIIEPEDKEKRYSITKKLNERKEKFLRNQSRIRYDKIPNTIPGEEEVDEVSLAVNNDQPVNDITIITAEQFAKEHIAFEKTTLKWWPKNKILSTEDFEVLDIPDIVGTEWMDRIGEFEPDTVYVRNFTSETDYEIVQEHDSYYDYVEG